METVVSLNKLFLFFFWGFEYVRIRFRLGWLENSVEIQFPRIPIVLHSDYISAKKKDRKKNFF